MTDKTQETLFEKIADHPRATLRWLRIWRRNRFIEGIEHQDILGTVIEDGRMTSRYSFMITMSCAIAMLGLLLSSPAVVIGAMLISPLMGPIMSLGFSLCVVDFKQMRKALEALAIGVVLALAISMLIVFLSPLTDATPEILARTKPNLFDLLVAVFSGLAGGYATIRQKGGAIVGVAIATALMPPIAVVGYGLATASWTIAGGAFFLFMTNLLAISLCVTMLAKWYGFGSHNSPGHTIWQTFMVFVVFAILSFPLGLSLSKIAYQAYATKTVQFEIENYFQESASRIGSFDINFTGRDSVRIDSVVITDAYQPDAEKMLLARLQSQLDTDVELSLDQIIVARNEQQNLAAAAVTDTALTNSVQTRLKQVSLRDDMIKTVRNAAFFPLQFINIETDQKSLSVSPAASSDLNIAQLRSFEQSLQARFPDWMVMVIPNVQTLPPVYFEIGESDISASAREKIDDSLWALRRWNIDEVLVLGYASTVGGTRSRANQQLAYQRAENVAGVLQAGGISTRLRSEFGQFDQRGDERSYGINSLHKVEIRLAAPALFEPRTQAYETPSE